MKRWVCPKCQDGVLAPASPRRLDVRRYCLRCSAAAPDHLLVERICPSAEQARERQKAARAAKVASKAAAQREAALKARTVAGLDIAEVARRCWVAMAPKLREASAATLLVGQVDSSCKPATDNVLRLKLGRQTTWCFPVVRPQGLWLVKNPPTLLLSVRSDPAWVWAKTLWIVACASRKVAPGMSPSVAELMSAASLKLWGVALDRSEPLHHLYRVLSARANGPAPTESSP